MVAIRKVGDGDVGRAAETLTAAFLDDPVWAFFAPDPAKRPRGLRTYFAQQLRHVYVAKDHVFMTEDGGGVAIWSPPDTWQQSFWIAVRGLPNMVRTSGVRALPTMFKTLTILEKTHRQREEPHWYLPFIGVAPEHQGKAYGSALLDHMLERCDNEGRPAYLEASTERSRALYHRHAFELVEELRLPNGGPPMWPMWRQPR